MIYMTYMYINLCDDYIVLSSIISSKFKVGENKINYWFGTVLSMLDFN